MNRSLCSLALAALCLWSCDSTVQDSDFLPEDPVFADIQPTLASCATAGCHAGTTPAAGLALDTYDGVERGSRTSYAPGVPLIRNAVIPFEPALSHLVHVVNPDPALAPTVEHPAVPGFSLLTQQQTSTLVQWLRIGAPNAPGMRMYSNATAEQFLITSQTGDLLSYIDPATGLVTKTVPLYSPLWPAPQTPARGPHYLAVGQYPTVYVTLIKEGKLLKVNMQNRSILDELTIEGSPAHVELTGDGRYAVISNFSTRNQVVIVDLTSFSIKRTISALHASPHGMALLPDGRTLYVGGNTSDLLYRVDIETGATESFTISPATPPTGAVQPELGPYQLRYNPDDRNLYISCQISNEVRIWNTDSRTLVATLPVGKIPLLMSFRPNSTELWVANKGDSSVSVIDRVSRTVRSITGLPRHPHGIAFTSDGALAGVTCENQGSDDPHNHGGSRGGVSYVAFLDAATATLRSVTEVGAFAAGIDVVTVR